MGSRALGAVVYVVLFVLGAVVGVVGSFQYSQSPVPWIAVLLDVVIFATCCLAGWGTESLRGALVPGVGWLLAAFLLSMGSHSGSVIITATPAGEWYLYGGTLAVVLGALAAFLYSSRQRLSGPGRGPAK